MRRIFITLAMMMLLGTSNLFAQEITPGKEIDLGLPSGTIWAGWNVGATSPEQYGDHYAWGEIKCKEIYSLETYKFWADNNGDRKWAQGELVNIGSNISGTQYDVARQKWGGSWRMPTDEEFDELISQCIWERNRYNGVNGYKVVGPNGKCIFLPAGGSSPSDIGNSGFYWTAKIHKHIIYGYTDEAWALCFKYYGNLLPCRSYYSRIQGFMVRPVK